MGRSSADDGYEYADDSLLFVVHHGSWAVNVGTTTYLAKVIYQNIVKMSKRMELVPTQAV